MKGNYDVMISLKLKRQRLSFVPLSQADGLASKDSNTDKVIKKIVCDFSLNKTC